MKTEIGLTSPVVVLGVDVHPAIVSQVAVNPRVLACGGVVVVPGPWANEGASLSLGAIVADVG